MKASAPSPALARASARAWTSETSCTRMPRKVEQRAGARVLQDAPGEERDRDEERGHDRRPDGDDDDLLGPVHPAEVTDARQRERRQLLGRQERPAAVRAGVVGQW